MTKTYKKTTFQKPERDAMGQYIVPVDGKPLTALGNPTPGPADYHPRIDVTKNSLPHHSIAGKYKQIKGVNDIPGPADYTTTGELIWKDKKVSLKGRNKSHFQEEASKYCTEIGPARYNIKHQELGRDGPKYSIARKQRSDIYTGPPNNIVQPVDSRGFETPGPNYRPNSSYFGRGPKKSFGIARTTNCSNTPGPGDYNIGDAQQGPAYSFGTKLPPPPCVQRTVNKHSPSPNTYTLGTTIGKATAVIIATRRKEKPPEQDGPSPAAYYRRDELSYNNRPITLAYRWFDADEPVRPGPADYVPTAANLRKTPMFTNRSKTKPCYPDSLNYTHGDVHDTPGPGNYNTNKPFAQNDSPAYKIGEKLKEKENDVPAPNSYDYEHKMKIDAPAFSMGKRFEQPDSKINPGPAAYTPKLQEGTPKFSMTARPSIAKKEEKPAPNAYDLKSTGIGGPGSVGTTLKSRASPFVYSGFRSTNLLDDDPSSMVTGRS